MQDLRFPTKATAINALRGTRLFTRVYDSVSKPPHDHYVIPHAISIPAFLTWKAVVGPVEDFQSMPSEARILTPQSCRTGSLVCNILLCALLLFLTCPSIAYGQAYELEDFESYISTAFHKTHTIFFSGNDSLLIGLVSAIDVGSDGRIVIIDEIGRQAILFEDNGTYITHLDASQCNPEVRFIPTGAKIRLDSQVLVLGTSPWGFLFDGNGQCKGTMSIEFTSTRHYGLVVDGADSMVGLYSTGTGQVLRFMDGFGRSVREVRLSKSPAPGVDYRWRGGGLVKTRKYLYFATPSSALIQLDLDGRPVQVFEFENRWFRQINQDVPDPFDPDSRRLDKHLTRVVQDRSRVYNVFLLDDDLVMIQYHNGADRGTGLQVFDDAGNLVTELLQGDDFFSHARDGLAYRVVQPDMNGSRDLPNPHLEVYEYRAR